MGQIEKRLNKKGLMCKISKIGLYKCPIFSSLVLLETIRVQRHRNKGAPKRSH
jgi:hypothetical protein